MKKLKPYHVRYKIAKNKAWKLCSEFNRRKDCDWRGWGKCCTCNKPLEWKNGDAGHFMAGRGNAVLFDDRGINLQCKHCNHNQGEQYLYSKFLEIKYSKKVVAELEAKRHSTLKYTLEDLEDIIKEYKGKIAKLNN